jgi:hypothetical protein
MSQIASFFICMDDDDDDDDDDDVQPTSYTKRKNYYIT